MGKKAAYYEVAKNLYVLEGKTLEEIASQLGISVVTLSRWKREGNWDELRIRQRAEREHFMELYQQVRLKLLKKANALLDDAEGLDSQTLWALLSILRTIKPPAPEVVKQLEEERKTEITAGELKKIIADVLRTEYGIES